MATVAPEAILLLPFLIKQIQGRPQMNMELKISEVFLHVKSYSAASFSDVRHSQPGAPAASCAQAVMA